MAIAIARRSHTFAASLLGAGRNVYLSEKYFWMMMGAAALLHLVIFGGLSLFPNDEVEEIPVHVINLKLGDDTEWQPTPSAPVTPVAEPMIAVPQPEAVAPVVEAPAPAPMPVEERVADTSDITFEQKPPVPEVKPEPVEKVLPEEPEQPKAKPVEKAKEKAKPLSAKVEPKRIKIDDPKDAAAQKKRPSKNAIPQNNLPRIIQGEVTKAQAVPTDSVSATPLAPPSSKPRQYVRAITSPGSPSGSAEGTETGGTVSEIKARYEQQISLWLAKHKHYPAAARMLGQHGKPTLRIRIDRQGNLKFAAVEQATGYRLIDDAALEMAKRANPLPAPPEDYPGGKLLEFRIPVSFDLQ